MAGLVASSQGSGSRAWGDEGALVGGPVHHDKALEMVLERVHEQVVHALMQKLALHPLIQVCHVGQQLLLAALLDSRLEKGSGYLDACSQTPPWCQADAVSPGRPLPCSRESL